MYRRCPRRPSAAFRTRSVRIEVVVLQPHGHGGGIDFLHRTQAPLPRSGNQCRRAASTVAPMTLKACRQSHAAHRRCQSTERRSCRRAPHRSRRAPNDRAEVQRSRRPALTYQWSGWLFNDRVVASTTHGLRRQPTRGNSWLAVASACRTGTPDHSYPRQTDRSPRARCRGRTASSPRRLCRLCVEGRARRNASCSVT